MNKNLYMLASFGNFKRIPAGGGQTAARRLLNTLRDVGFDVSIFNRHRLYFQNKILDRISMLIGVAIDPILFFFYLLFRRRKKSAVLFMSYCGSLLPFDFLITLVTKMLGFRNIFYYAGGGGNHLYKNGSALYKLLFKLTMRMYDEIMLEGFEGISLIQSVSKTKTFYLPNFSEIGFAPKNFSEKDKEVINCIYFGRISLQKNILLIIDIFKILADKYNNIKLTIVGSGGKSYEEEVTKHIENTKYKDRIHKISRVDHKALQEILSNQHFFIFPSAEPREGHSNALNEAMSCGIIPIVSANNFLPSIVGNNELVVDNYEAKSYAKAVFKIIEQDKIGYYSKLMFERVRLNFTQEVVEEKLKKELETFFLEK